MIAFDAATSRYSYRARFAANDMSGLLRHIRNHENGLRLKDVVDAYPCAFFEMRTYARFTKAYARCLESPLLGVHSKRTRT